MPKIIFSNFETLMKEFTLSGEYPEMFLLGLGEKITFHTNYHNNGMLVPIEQTNGIAPKFLHSPHEPLNNTHIVLDYNIDSWIPKIFNAIFPNTLIETEEISNLNFPVAVPFVDSRYKPGENKTVYLIDTNVTHMLLVLQLPYTRNPEESSIFYGSVLPVKLLSLEEEFLITTIEIENPTITIGVEGVGYGYSISEKITVTPNFKIYSHRFFTENDVGEHIKNEIYKEFPEDGVLGIVPLGNEGIDYELIPHPFAYSFKVVITTSLF